MTKQLIENIREILQQKNFAAFVNPVSDEFLGEYTPPHAKRVEFISGFSGSNGFVIISQDKAAIFSDARYRLQMKQQVDSQIFEIYDLFDLSPIKWLEDNVDGVIAYDPWLFSISQIERFSHLQMQASENIIDLVWQDPPLPPQTLAYIIDEAEVGKNHQQKLQDMRDNIPHDVAGIYISDPESVNWLFNIRASDLEYTPISLCHAFITKDEAYLIGDLQKFENLPYSAIDWSEKEIFLGKYSGHKIIYDPATSPQALKQIFLDNNIKVISRRDPCHIPKACKNKIEISAIKRVHLLDGIAMVRFLAWLDEQAMDKAALDEVSIAEKLEHYRRQNADYICPSFPTICGFNANGAIVHYRAEKETAAKVRGNGLLLIDSGGQYRYGTTDITRTIAIGEVDSSQKMAFTLVLKGHIAIANSRFPVGTMGYQLDSLARQFLWRAGMDYDHGTGHGVGHFLSVHEGPQSISKRAGDVLLQEGMVLSNEPGYYLEKKYGIRIENLVFVQKSKVRSDRHFLEFNTLSMVPIDRRLILASLLGADELLWLNVYHETICRLLSPMLSEGEKQWLASACSPVGV